MNETRPGWLTPEQQQQKATVKAAIYGDPRPDPNLLATLTRMRAELDALIHSISEMPTGRHLRSFRDTEIQEQCFPTPDRPVA